MNRPLLSKEIGSAEFTKWYWLKEELVVFCRAEGIPASGSKEILTARICEYLDNGSVNACRNVRKKAEVPANKDSVSCSGEITLDSVIGENFVCSEKHRAFFRNQIGKSFSFNVAFQKWLKSNPDKTFADAVEAYREIKTQARVGKARKEIDKQFEYNTYVRDFFEHNKGRSLEDAIKCWKYKKSLPGPNVYEDSDLEALGRT